MVPEFIHDLKAADLPDPVRMAARIALLDTLGVAAAATRTEVSRIARGHAAALFGAGGAGASLMFDGRRVSPAGAALAGAATVDSVDAHDGWRPSKGHAGCHVIPAALACCEAEGVAGGDELLAQVVIGYEIGCRVAAVQHATVPEYHASGSWGAVGAAAVGARALRLGRAQTREALGIGEYHGPRSQMLRVTTHPTMVKDSSGWGAMVGVSAAYLAREGFTGAPAVTVEAPEAAPWWADLGSRWIMTEQYIKPYPTCRWSHAPIRAVLDLAAAHGITHHDVARIEIATFAEAMTLATARPRTTDEAQYSLPFPVAVALVRGDVGPADIDGAALTDPEILRLSTGLVMREDPACSAAFPGRRLARAALVLTDGRRVESGPTEPLGDPERPLSEAQIRAKFHAYAAPVTGAARAGAIERALMAVEGESLADLVALLAPPPAVRAAAE
ncbi:MAG: MmgE/PrpD family protein [Thermohalobaculum sp.]|nr:MmgE/PrpD family protein [Thermohalobaculum sp.]